MFWRRKPWLWDITIWYEKDRYEEVLGVGYQWSHSGLLTYRQGSASITISPASVQKISIVPHEENR